MSATPRYAILRSGSGTDRLRLQRSVYPLMAPARNLSKSSFRLGQEHVTQQSKVPSKLEVAYLQSLLKEAGISSPLTTQPGKPSLWSRFKWFCIGFFVCPFILSGLGELYFQGSIPGTDRKLTDARRKLRENYRISMRMLENQNDSQPEMARIDPPQTKSSSEEVSELQSSLAAVKAGAEKARAQLQQYLIALRAYKQTCTRQHKNMIQTLCASDRSSSVILDDALLHSRPIKFSTSKLLDPSRAALVRVLDATGKNEIIILAFEMDDFEKTKKKNSDADWPAERSEVMAWMWDLEEHFHLMDANSGHGVDLYCMSNGVLVDVGKRGGQRVAIKYDITQVPPGFPLRQLRQIETVHPPAANLKNSSSLQSADSA